jgi:putative hemolysin
MQEHAQTPLDRGIIDASRSIIARSALGLPHETAGPALEAVWARDDDELRAAQALRWRVFVQEMGATITPPRGTPAGLDADLFDPYCEHLLVRTVPVLADEPAQVVGTYRVLTPAAARRVGGLYSESEFDLLALAPLRTTLAELGRSCIDPQWRQGGVIMMLWAALASFMQRNGLTRMVGCASVPMHDGGHAAASLWRQLERTHLAPIELRVRPRCALPVDRLRGDLGVEPPPLIRGYLKCGAKLLGAPAWDPAFNTADLPLLLDLRDLPASYRRRFIDAA